MQSSPSEEFVRELADCQARLFVYFISLVPDPESARDIVQNTNVVLWQKYDQFEEGSNFIAWALSVARLEVLAYVRSRSRDRHFFDLDLIATLADSAKNRASTSSRMVDFLEECMQLRTPDERRMLNERYKLGFSVNEMAEQHECSPSAMSQKLSRIRQKLQECIGRRMEASP